MIKTQPIRKVPFSLDLFAAPSGGSNDDARSCSRPGFSALEPLLPASCRNFDNIELPSFDFDYLHKELGVERLNKIHHLLWLVGRPMPPRPLHYQRAASREIVIMEQMDLHLVWEPARIFLKPIPPYLLDYDFWERNLLCGPYGCLCCTKWTSTNTQGRLICKQRQLYECALGFLLSYIALIQHESDFHIAKAAYLLPENVTWLQWVEFTKQLLCSKMLGNINERYRFGELRLQRLNWIYRLIFLHYRGYSQWHRTYSDFFSHNLAPIASIVGYVALVLASMQVGLATERLKDDGRFNRASFGFTVFAILAPLVICVVLVSLSLCFFLDNLRTQLQYVRRRFSTYDRLRESGQQA